MTLGLDQRCIAKLRESVLASLADIKINNNMFIDFPSAISLFRADNILPTSGPIKIKLDNYIGDQPLFRFIFESISKDLYETESYDKNKKAIPLNSFSKYSDLSLASDDIINKFESLPWKYIISFELDNNFGHILKKEGINRTISDKIKLILPNSEYDTVYPLKSGIEKRDINLFDGIGFLTIPQDRRWNQETSYIQFDAEGFIGNYTDLVPMDNVISNLKSFLGLSLAVRLIKFNKIAASAGLNYLYSVPKKNYMIIHQYNNDIWRIHSTVELPHDISEAMIKLDINDSDGKIKDISSWINRGLLRISYVFKNAKTAERLLLAGQWLLDSYLGKNELLSFLQAMVTIEILLGDDHKKETVGVGELLRNRCAYLIGDSYSQREKLIKEFEKIYDIRSRIVHKGKSKLDAEESVLSKKLKWMCRRVIEKEIDLIIKDDEESKQKQSSLL